MNKQSASHIVNLAGSDIHNERPEAKAKQQC